MISLSHLCNRNPVWHYFTSIWIGLVLRQQVWWIFILGHLGYLVVESQSLLKEYVILHLTQSRVYLYVFKNDHFPIYRWQSSRASYSWESRKLSFLKDSHIISLNPFRILTSEAYFFSAASSPESKRVGNFSPRGLGHKVSGYLKYPELLSIHHILQSWATLRLLVLL